MKKLVLAILTAFQVTACTVVRFETPQPADVVALNDFPEEMRGVFISEDQDTLEINTLEFHFRNGEEIQVRGNLSTAETVLKEFRNYYILSLKEEGEWDVFPVKVKKGNIHLFIPSNAPGAEELMEELKKTSPVKEISGADGDFDHYLINPTSEEFRYLLKKNLFDEKIIFKRME